MLCPRCLNPDVPRLFVVELPLSENTFMLMELCGCCSITVEGGFAITGQNYTNQCDPENYEPVKEKEIALRYMETTSGRDHIDSRTAKRWKRVFVDDEKKAEALRGGVSEKVRRQKQEVSREIERQSEQNLKDRIAKVSTKLDTVYRHAHNAGVCDV